jgi:nucleolar protein 12
MDHRCGVNIAQDANGVEAALLFDGKSFPPMLPRKLRVVRAKGMKRKPANTSKQPLKVDATGTAKLSSARDKSSDRSRQLLGRAGASKIKNPESFVFEGHRASSKDGKSGLKLGGGGKRRNRSTRRSAAWRTSAGKKPGKA